VIQSNPPVPKFYTEAHKAISLWLPSRIIPHNGTKVHTTKEHTQERLINVWPQFCMPMTVDTAIWIVLLRGVHLNPHDALPSIPGRGNRVAQRGTYHSLALLSPATSTTDGTHQMAYGFNEGPRLSLASVLDLRVQRRPLAPHWRHLRCTLPPTELWRSWFQYAAMPFAIKPGTYGTTVMA
jgi:hypothetical protein